MSRLAIHKSLRFSDLARNVGLSSGNLATHLQRLERAGYVRQELLEKAVQLRKTIHVTEAGDAAFRAYVRELKVFLKELGEAD